MASSSEKSTAKANLVGKRNWEDDSETKSIPKKHEEKDTTNESGENSQQIEFLEETTKGFVGTLLQIETNTDLISAKKESTIRKKTLCIIKLPPKNKIPDIIDFFKGFGEVVRVQLTVNKMCEPMHCGFVEFASINQAKEALQNYGEFLDDSKICLTVARNHKRPKPKFCIDHKVCSRDYLRRVSLPIDPYQTPSDFVEVVLFVANLSPQAKILHVINFFKNVGVVSVRLIVNHEGKHVGYGFVEFASSKEAKKALDENYGEYMLDHQIFLGVFKSASYPRRSKYNLPEMLCYDDYLRRESLLKGGDETPNFVEVVAIRKKTLLVANLCPQTGISDIIKFFKDAGEVVHVRLIVNHKGKHVGYGYVEFVSAIEAKKALEKKNGEYLHDRKIDLAVARTDPYLPRPKYCIDHKVWYEDYLRRESLLIEEDKPVEGFDETPDLVEEVAIRKKSLFVANLSWEITISHILHFFINVGKVRIGKGKVRSVRLIVNHMGEHVGCAFVEFASADEAKRVLLTKNCEIFYSRKVFLSEVEVAPYPLRPKYNLAEMLWYKDYLRRESFLSFLLDEDDLETKPNVEEQVYDDLIPKLPIFCGTLITFSDDDD